MKNKFFSLLLAVSLIASCIIFIPASAAPASDISEAQKVLSDLGIIDIADDVNAPMTRGEFATEFANIMNVVKMPAGYKIPFTDVTEQSSCYEGVYNLYAWRAISEAQLFRPDDIITSSEALKIAVSLLGYDFLALANGGYPQGYAAAASQIGIAPKGMGATITKGQAHEILFNMLYVKMPSVTITGDGTYNYSAKTGGLFLEEMWDMTVETGMVTDGERYGINYNLGVGDGFVGIDGLKLKKGDFDTDSYFGEEVDVYYDTKTMTVRAIYPREDSSSRIVLLRSSQDINFERGTYTYPVSDTKEKTMDIAYDATIVYNGEIATYDESKMIPARGTVKLISFDGGDADMVIIQSYEEAVAGTIVAANFLISDKSTDGVSYSFDDENITYTTQDGAPAKFENIKENDVLWITKDSEGKINDVIICSDIIVGELTGTSDSAVYIDDRKYEATDTAFADMKANYQLGSILRGCINPDGKIIHFVSENDVSGYQVGYLMKTQLRARGLSASIYVKILGTDGLYHEYYMADSFVINGIVFKNDAEASYNALPKQEGYESSLPMSIVMYMADKTDKITLINYPDNIAKTINVNGKTGEARGLWKNAQIVDMSDEYIQYKASDKTIFCKGNSRIFPGSTFTRFLVPDPKDTASSEDKDYKVQAPTGYMTKQAHYAYALSEDAVESQYMVSVYSSETGTGDSHTDTAPIYLITSISGIINDEGDAVERLECMNTSGTTAEFYSDEQGYFSKLGLKFGDLVKINADGKKMVQGISIFYRAGEDSLNVTDAGKIESTLSGVKYTLSENNCIANSNNGMVTLGGSYIIAGNVYHRDGVVMKVLPLAKDPAAYDPDVDNLFSFSASGKKMVVCNLETETATSGTVNDIKSYLDFGENGNKVVIQTYSGTVNCIYLYEQ